ncbi:helix-turn-helix domain-containing protein [Mesobacillus foraminis]|uniref:helix-turn-helix domain-containing protein n=1 Tax=Mesobacillus foraminis TaxID=279826 RepID=UPI000EF4D78C|nr:helix-turn-helix domain-containing protein [Mesobacillus foraminis]
MVEKKFLTVKDTAELFNKSTETIKRWLRNEKDKNEKFPNAFINSDKEGWKIPVEDINNFLGSQGEDNYLKDEWLVIEREAELIEFGYEVVNFKKPTPEVMSILLSVGITRAMEIIQMMRNSEEPIRSPIGFITKAIRLNWTLETAPQKLLRQKGKQGYESSKEELVGDSNVEHVIYELKRVFELTQEDFKTHPEIQKQVSQGNRTIVVTKKKIDRTLKAATQDLGKRTVPFYNWLEHDC